jgi:acetyl esterase/lipase
MTRFLFLLGIVLLSLRLSAQQPAWQPAPGHTQIPIWPGPAPDPQPVRGPERTTTDPADRIAGKTVTAIRNVTVPTMTVYAPIGAGTGADTGVAAADTRSAVKNGPAVDTGTAIVVFPGGGFQILAIDLEGTEVCDWLATRGITCILLKYRVTDVGPYPKSGPYPESPMALEDAQRTLGLVRFHAAEWHIDPHRIGVLGFSAGGGLVAAASNEYAHRIYAPIDAADRLSCRPDFAVAVYPGHLSLGAAQYDASLGRKKFPLPAAGPQAVADPDVAFNPLLHLTAQTPPTFLLQAEDDHVDSPYDSLAYFLALKQAGVPTELHIYAHGNHAFGLRPNGLPITGWPALVETWLRTIGMIPR